jgi:hypothetical protein
MELNNYSNEYLNNNKNNENINILANRNELADIKLEKINSLKVKINPLLEELKKLYVLSKLHPENIEIQNQYENIKKNIDELKNNFLILLNEIDINIDELNKKLLVLNTLIIQERNINKSLKKKKIYVETKNNASNELINDYENIYNKNYLKNWGIILSGILCLFLINKIYKSK